MKVHMMSGMNKLDVAKRAQILATLCEGASMRSVSRLADVSINSVSKLLEDAGRFCAGFHDAKVRNVKAKRVQVDEIWSFTAAKAKNVPTMKNPVDGAGDTWTWTAIEADTKLIISHFVGGRDGECAAWFMDDVAARVANRIQLTSDGHKAYLEAVEGAFGADIDYAMLNKIYGASPEAAKGRYSPAECIGAKKERIEGKPDMANAQSPVHAPNECVFQEIREPRAYGRDLECLVQLHSHSQDASHHTCDGGRIVQVPHDLGRPARDYGLGSAETRTARPLQKSDRRNFKLRHYPAA
jgi:lambda repressor-like predicted transcriptional regulator